MANTNYISNVNPRDWTAETAGFTPGDGEIWYYHSHPDYSGVVHIIGDGATAFSSLRVYYGSNEFPSGIEIEDSIVLDGAGYSQFFYKKAGNTRWNVYYDPTDDSYAINRHDASGTFIANAVSISNSTGVFTLEGQLDAKGGIANSIGNVSVSDNLDVVGALTKGSGSFKIDHPLKPETHHLIHSFIEGPQADNIYRGKISLKKGEATVNIDVAAGMMEGTFEALNREIQVFTTNESGWNMVRGSVDGNILTIEAKSSCDDIISWMVIGERKDKHMMDTDWTDKDGKVIVEPLKKAEKK